MHELSPDLLIHTLRWQDPVDVLLLTLLFSAAYRRFRHTVAVQVAVGLMTLVAGSWLANRIGLILTSYLLSAIGAVATIIIVVVFQHEIRQGLSRVSPLRWFGRQRDKVGPFDSRATVARAAFSIAARKKGALIVIPRHEAIDALVSAGVEVDARLSVPVLEAVFTASSPIHDGAVVVSDNRLLRASVVLPLATESADTSHGTRHRAARGLAQATDALVVCVSEEHGTVSLAHGEILEPMAEQTQLVAALRRFWTDDGRRARQPVTGARVRLGSVLAHLAILICVAASWAALALDRSHMVAKVVPLEIRGIAEGLSFDPLRNTSVVLELRGSRRELDRLSPTAVHSYLDLSASAPGLRTFRVQAEVPPGIEVANSAPASVELRIRARAAPGAGEPGLAHSSGPRP